MVRTLYILTALFLLHSCVFSQEPAGKHTESLGDSTFSATSQHPLAEAALELTAIPVTYDPSYFSIPYPGGDVPEGKGVCTDVVVRAFRKVNRDLQKEVHEDMEANFEVYPDNWGLNSPDSNIDHRRVPNLMTYFSRQGNEKPVSKNPSEYYSGDVVAWDLGHGILHIGIVYISDGKPLIVHNIGGGQVLEDCLFDFEIIGHFRVEMERDTGQ